ncbi:MAG: SPOR domain-containing protein [Bacteroidales bacterium]|nr:SPOR domain-containing protein [Bacteroidales bacterium]MDY0215324.1 SPOR domain-containing protein [Bacteroidales bacterium]
MKTFCTPFLSFLLLIINIWMFPSFIKAQEVNIQKEAGIEELTTKYIQANEKVKSISGFRVQIFFDSGNNSRNAAETIQSRFNAKHHGTPSYLTFREPNFRIRVGDFRTRHEARGFLRQIQAEYPNAFVIKDEINLSPVFSNFYDNSIEN